MKPLKYTTSKNTEKTRLDVIIVLGDDCHNGRCDFSITADGYRKARNGRWVHEFGGCCHDEILKLFPEFAPFVALHLSSSKGVPMYAVENGRYILEKEGVEKCAEYLRISVDTASQLDTTSNELFKYQLFSLGIVEKWEKEAKEAIAQLEALCGCSFEDYEEPRHALVLTDEERDDMERKISEGFFTPESVEKRKEEKDRKEREEQRAKLVRYYDDKIRKYETERDIMILIFDTFGVHSNVIYYDHRNTIAFNWVERHFATYDKHWTRDEVAKFEKVLEDSPELSEIDLKVELVHEY